MSDEKLVEVSFNQPVFFGGYARSEGETVHVTEAQKADFEKRGLIGEAPKAGEANPRETGYMPEELANIGALTAAQVVSLANAGYRTPDEVLGADPNVLQRIPGIDGFTLERLQREVDEVERRGAALNPREQFDLANMGTVIPEHDPTRPASEQGDETPEGAPGARRHAAAGVAPEDRADPGKQQTKAQTKSQAKSEGENK